jgi:hypothetical protein
MCVCGTSSVGSQAESPAVEAQAALEEIADRPDIRRRAVQGCQAVRSDCLGNGTPAGSCRDSCAACLWVHLDGPARHGSHEQCPAHRVRH